jgi:hypothetical protein
VNLCEGEFCKEGKFAKSFFCKEPWLLQRAFFAKERWFAKDLGEPA